MQYRIIRLLQVLDDLSYQDWVPIDRLACDHGVDPRTLGRDITFLRDAGIPIERRQGRVRLPARGLRALRRMMLESTIPGWRTTAPTPSSSGV